ncbi:alpha/beta hydrolase [Demequina sediminicola]|uniref:alpha/beta hydrolase n=1 Tax=Demequina sediminicola TaxID=1095026 RepID=UPI0007854AA6|nr:alpha/beta hydrolase [Demequina sediminicola]
MSTAPPARTWDDITAAVVATLGLLLVAAITASTWDALVHAHPLYPVLLVVTVLVCVWVLWRSLARPRERSRGRTIWRVVCIILGAAWLALMLWLVPMGPEEPAVSAMDSGNGVTVTETATSITLTPDGEAEATGLFFQPGALVDARAYAAIVRPVAEVGYQVVIPKQPAGIAFLSVGAFESAVDSNPTVDEWIVGGHSLGGVVAAIEADANDHGSEAEGGSANVAGLLFYGSYPADNINSTLTAEVLSISGTEDGLSTPAKVEASRELLPADATFIVIEGASHAYFGDYGVQSGDGTPTISHDEARQQISEATVDFVNALAR